MTIIFYLLAAAGCYFGFTSLESPWNYYVPAIVIVVTTILVAHIETKPDSDLALEIKGMKWSVMDICQNVLLTGGIGSGKTNAINYIAWNLTQHQHWGGLWLDNKGNSHADLKVILESKGRIGDVLVLDVRAQPGERLYYNVLADPAFTDSILAAAIAEVTSSEGGKNSDFFKEQTILHITQTLKGLRVLDEVPTFTSIYPILTDGSSTTEFCERLMASERSAAVAVARHFESNFLAMPPDQFGGVTGTITNCLSPFINPDVAAVTSNVDQPNGFAFEDMDKGKVLCLSLPQTYLRERLALNALLKQLFYQFGLMRYDIEDKEMLAKNLRCLWLDEAQHSLRAGAFGDYRFLDRLRAARCAAFLAMQDHTSCYPTLGKEVTGVTLAQLRTRVIFSAPTFESAEISSQLIGKREVMKTTRGVSGGKASVSRSPHEEYVLKPQDITGLPNYQCHIVHAATKKIKRRVKLPLCEPARGILPR